jgi:hypothetical protein
MASLIFDNDYDDNEMLQHMGFEMLALAPGAGGGFQRQWVGGVKYRAGEWNLLGRRGMAEGKAEPLVSDFDPTFRRWGDQDKVKDQGRKLSLFELKENYPNVDWDDSDEGTTDVTAALIDQRRIKDKRFALALHMQKDLAGKVGGFAGGLLSAMWDPYNLAIGAIPFFGPIAAPLKMLGTAVAVGARTVPLLAGRGFFARTLTRARFAHYGKLSAGWTAAFEVPIARQIVREKGDWEFSHSVMNIAAGGLLGGVLGVAGGKFGDWIRHTPTKRYNFALQMMIKNGMVDEGLDVSTLNSVAQSAAHIRKIRLIPDKNVRKFLKEGGDITIEKLREIYAKTGKGIPKGFFEANLHHAIEEETIKTDSSKPPIATDTDSTNTVDNVLPEDQGPTMAETWQAGGKDVSVEPDHPLRLEDFDIVQEKAAVVGYPAGAREIVHSQTGETWVQQKAYKNELLTIKDYIVAHLLNRIMPGHSPAAKILTQKGKMIGYAVKKTTKKPFDIKKLTVMTDGKFPPALKFLQSFAVHAWLMNDGWFRRAMVSKNGDISTSKVFIRESQNTLHQDILNSFNAKENPELANLLKNMSVMDFKKALENLAAITDPEIKELASSLAPDGVSGKALAKILIARRNEFKKVKNWTSAPEIKELLISSDMKDNINLSHYPEKDGFFNFDILFKQVEGDLHEGKTIGKRLSIKAGELKKYLRELLDLQDQYIHRDNKPLAAMKWVAQPGNLEKLNNAKKGSKAAKMHKDLIDAFSENPAKFDKDFKIWIVKDQANFPPEFNLNGKNEQIVVMPDWTVADFDPRPNRNYKNPVFIQLFNPMETRPLLIEGPDGRIQLLFKPGQAMTIRTARLQSKNGKTFTHLKGSMTPPDNTAVLKDLAEIRKIKGIKDPVDEPRAWEKRTPENRVTPNELTDAARKSKDNSNFFDHPMEIDVKLEAKIKAASAETARKTGKKEEANPAQVEIEKLRTSVNKLLASKLTSADPKERASAEKLKTMFENEVKKSKNIKKAFEMIERCAVAKG